MYLYLQYTRNVTETVLGLPLYARCVDLHVQLCPFIPEEVIDTWRDVVTVVSLMLYIGVLLPHVPSHDNTGGGFPVGWLHASIVVLPTYVTVVSVRPDMEGSLDGATETYICEIQVQLFYIIEIKLKFTRDHKMILTLTLTHLPKSSV